MRSSQAIGKLGRLAAWQHGYVTRTQAAQMGVTADQLRRLALDEAVEHVIRGVYRVAGAPGLRFEFIFAEWLATDPGRSYEERLNRPWEGFVAAADTASTLHEVGVFAVDTMEFVGPLPKRNPRQGVAFRVRKLAPDDVVIVEEVPALTVAATVADLIDQCHDLSIIGDLVDDARHFGKVDEEDMLRRIDQLPPTRRHNLRAAELLKWITESC